MGGSETNAPRIFFDTSVVLACAFSKRGASYVLIELANLTLIEGRISPDVREEVLRNAPSKMPAAMPALRSILSEYLIEGPAPSAEMLITMRGYADVKDVPILAAAIEQRCRYLVTLNERDFWPPSTLITIVRPGDLLSAIRKQVGTLIMGNDL